MPLACDSDNRINRQSISKVEFYEYLCNNSTTHGHTCLTNMLVQYYQWPSNKNLMNAYETS